MTKESQLGTTYSKIIHKDHYLTVTVLEIKGRPHYEPEFVSIYIHETCNSYRIPLDKITEELKLLEHQLANR